MAIFILDSNFFIQAHRSTYPLDVAISFWEKVKKLAQEGKIVSIDKVKGEIFGKGDDLENWCKDNLPENFFLDSSQVLSEYSRVAAWAISKKDNYLLRALTEFLDSDEADAFLIAHSLSDPSKYVLVTQEISNPNRRNKIKIPEPCIDLGLRYVSLIEMFRELGERF